MRTRLIQTSITRDEWFISLSLEEQRFWLQMMITERAEICGVFQYSDRDMRYDMEFFSTERLTFLKKRIESDCKAYFYKGWVWMPNFSRHNYFCSPQQQVAGAKQLHDVQSNFPDVIKHFQEKGLVMPDVSDYLEKRRRNKIKKQLRLSKPYLMGAQLDQEVDRIMGISDSGVMDWAAIAKTEVSDHPTPESVTQAEVREVAGQFGIRPYHLYWFYMQKVTKLQAGGRKRNDYLAVLKDCATTALKKELSDEEKITAVLMFGAFTNVTVTRADAQRMIFKGEL